MIADKITSALNHIIFVIQDFIETLNTHTNPHTDTRTDTHNPSNTPIIDPSHLSNEQPDIYANIKEIELEFLCALANDNALHIEEVIRIVNNFEIDEIRTKIDDIFDPVVTNLVTSGQLCLKKLSNLIIFDVSNELLQVFMYEWLEGAQINVLIATLNDYMNDICVNNIRWKRT